MPAAVETLQVLRTRVDREAVQAVTVRRRMKPVRLSLEVCESGFVAFSVSDVPEFANDRAVRTAGFNHLRDRGGFALAEKLSPLIGKLNLLKTLGERAVIVLVALRDAASIKALCNDGVRHA